MVEPSRDVLEDLAFRFILNCPEEELESFERILFLVEQAWWFYEDFYREENKALKNMNLKEFTSIMFKQVPGLKKYQKFLDDIYAKFTSYKFKIPVMGAIILNQTLDKALLVKGWKSGSSWGWPKGKINKDESDANCAVREVFEETGFDISSRLVESDYVEINNGQQRMKLFIVARVPEDAHFEPQTRKEISKIGWHPVSDLPRGNSGAGEKGVAAQKAKVANEKYFMVSSSVGPLRKWISQHKKKGSVPDLIHLHEPSRVMLHAASTPAHLSDQGMGAGAGAAQQQGGGGEGGAWLNFRLDHGAVMRSMVFPA